MKKPNVKKWAKREMKEIRADPDSPESTLRLAKVSRRLAKSYEQIKRPKKARIHYMNAGKLYERMNRYDSAKQMYGKAGIQEKVQEMREVRDSRLRDRMKDLGLGVIGAMFIFTLSFLLIPQITGNAVSSTESGGAPFKIGLVIGGLFLFIFLLIKKRK